MSDLDLAMLTAKEFRGLCRSGQFDGPTTNVAHGFVQANLVVLPGPFAADFTEFCDKNPRPCPLLEATDSGVTEPRQLALGADLRFDLPRYRVMEHGTCTARPTSVEPLWRDDLVAFLIGCSFTFDHVLLRQGIPVRHLEQKRNVPMYRTNVACAPAGPFHGPLVVSMRPMRREQADRAAEITARLPGVHGAPIRIGDASSLGIDDLGQPDYGTAVDLHEDEIPVFWACGVTPMEAIQRARPPLAIVHEPGHMFVTDRLIADLHETV